MGELKSFFFVKKEKVGELKFECAFNLTEKVYKEKRKEKEANIIQQIGVAKYQWHSHGCGH